MGSITSKKIEPPQYRWVWRLVHIDGKVVKKLVREEVSRRARGK